jgi:hypothetical protein
MLAVLQQKRPCEGKKKPLDRKVQGLMMEQ